MIRVGLRARCRLPSCYASTWTSSADRGAASSASAPRTLRPVQRAGFPRGFVRAVSQEALSAATGETTVGVKPSPLAAAWGYCRDCDAVHSLQRTPRVDEEARCVLQKKRHDHSKAALLLQPLCLTPDCVNQQLLPCLAHRRLLETIRLRGGFDFDSGQPMDSKFSLTTKFPSPVRDEGRHP